MKDGKRDAMKVTLTGDPTTDVIVGYLRLLL